MVSDYLRRLIWERRLRENELEMRRLAELRDRVSEAFFEGYCSGMDVRDPAEAWQHSWARRDLFPGPPTPVHKRALLAARGLYDRLREPGGPGPEGMNERARVKEE